MSFGTIRVERRNYLKATTLLPLKGIKISDKDFFSQINQPVVTHLYLFMLEKCLTNVIK